QAWAEVVSAAAAREEVGRDEAMAALVTLSRLIHAYSDAVIKLDPDFLAAYRWAATGIMYLDAPVSGGGVAAAARTLTTIAAGDEVTYLRCRPVFLAFSANTAYMGRSGNGQMTKLLNNALTMSNLKNVVDVFSLAQRLDLNLTDFYKVVGASSGGSRILDALSQMTEELAAHLQLLMMKDIEHFADGVRANDQDPTELRARGLAGALGLVDVVGLLAHAQKRGFAG
ncbi:MAG: NAD(P)-dependent oxidoreductase, partial [Alphaproteobacteria bacterium]